MHHYFAGVSLLFILYMTTSLLPHVTIRLPLPYSPYFHQIYSCLIIINFSFSFQASKVGHPHSGRLSSYLYDMKFWISTDSLLVEVQSLAIFGLCSGTSTVPL